MSQRKKLGNRGERIAAAFLQKKGYQLLSTQFHSKYGEIDLVGIKRDTLVFFEVKTRSSDEYGTGLEAITSQKVSRLIKAAQYFKLRHPKTPDSMRIDAVVIETDIGENPLKIQHVKNIGSF